MKKLVLVIIVIALAGSAGAFAQGFSLDARFDAGINFYMLFGKDPLLALAGCPSVGLTANAVFDLGGFGLGAMLSLRTNLIFIDGPDILMEAIPAAVVRIGSGEGLSVDLIGGARFWYLPFADDGVIGIEAGVRVNLNPALAITLDSFIVGDLEIPIPTLYVDFRL